MVRFRNPQQGVVSFRDHVKGEVSVSNQELDDLIIARSDGSPTYNLSVVVDDMDMEITHVLRGDDHVNNTPRQVNILRALDAEVPEYAHVPMILGDDGKRLSKRHGAVGVMEYFEAGYLPEAMLNYLVRLGWSHGDQEIFTRAQMIELFSLDGLNKSASSFNTEKLNWINQQYLMSEPLANIIALVKQRLDRLGLVYDEALDFTTVVDLYRQRVSTVNQLVDSILYCFQDFSCYDEKGGGKGSQAGGANAIAALAGRLAGARKLGRGRDTCGDRSRYRRTRDRHGQGGPTPARGRYRRLVFATDRPDRRVAGKGAQYCPHRARDRLYFGKS